MGERGRGPGCGVRCTDGGQRQHKLRLMQGACTAMLDSAAGSRSDPRTGVDVSLLVHSGSCRLGLCIAQRPAVRSGQAGTCQGPRVDPCQGDTTLPMAIRAPVNSVRDGSANYTVEVPLVIQG